MILVKVICYVNVENHFLTFTKHITFTRIMLGMLLWQYFPKKCNFRQFSTSESEKWEEIYHNFFEDWGKINFFAEYSLMIMSHICVVSSVGKLSLLHDLSPPWTLHLGHFFLKDIPVTKMNQIEHWAPSKARLPTFKFLKFSWTWKLQKNSESGILKNVDVHVQTRILSS